MHFLLLWLLVALSTASADLVKNITRNKIALLEGALVEVNATLTYFLGNQTFVSTRLTVRCWMDDVKVAILPNWTDIHHLRPTNANSIFVNLKVIVIAKRIGRSKLICAMFGNNNTASSIYEDVVTSVVVTRIITIHEIVFKYGLIFLIVVITFVMGCDLDIGIVYRYLKSPISPSIGFLCQFLLMPLLSFALAKLTFIDNAFGFGLLTIGCSPGGGASNIWAVLFGGDLNLSMTMTFLSSCAALFMMPFWVFILGRFFVAIDDISIPYVDITYNLLQIVIPVGFGMLFRWKFKAAAILISKSMKILGLVYVIFVLSYGTYANLYLFKMMYDYPYLIPIGAGLPWLGFLFGYIISIATLRTRSHAVVIALETGIQNIGIAVLILKYSMPQPSGDLGAVIVIIVAVFTPLPLYLGYVIVTIKRKCFGQKENSIEEDDDSDKRDQKEDLLGHNGSKL